MSDTEVGSKRGNDEYENKSSKRPRNDNCNRFRFLLLAKNCGNIIGKGGENIKRLRNEFNVHMHLPDSQCRKRVLTIQGEKADSVAVLKELLSTCKEAPNPADDRKKMNFEINFLVSSDSVGAVIGKGGEQIREIDLQSGGKVTVYPGCLPDSTERVVAIGGDDESNVLSAFNIIIDLLENRPPKRPVKFYDPKNESFEGRHNGRNDMPDRGNQMGGGNQFVGGLGGGLAGLENLSNLANATTLLTQLGVNPQLSAALLAGATGGANLPGNNINQNFDDRNNDFNSNRNGGRDDRHSNDRRDDRRGGDRDNRDGGSDFSQMKTEVHVTVPNDMCGAIIGRSGQRIKDVKYKTGARLDFSKTEKNSKEDRVLTITGTQEQTVAAQRMIADMVMNRDD